MIGRTRHQAGRIGLAVVSVWLLASQIATAADEVQRVDLSRLRVLDVQGQRHVLALRALLSHNVWWRHLRRRGYPGAIGGADDHAGVGPVGEHER